jgi:hypothetical protein
MAGFQAGFQAAEAAVAEDVECRALALARRCAAEAATAFSPLRARAPPLRLQSTLPALLVGGPLSRPEAPAAAALPRREYGQLTVAAFLTAQVLPGAPVLLTNAAADWPALTRWADTETWLQPPLGARVRRPAWSTRGGPSPDVAPPPTLQVVPVELGVGGCGLSAPPQLVHTSLADFFHGFMRPAIQHAWPATGEGAPPPPPPPPVAYVSQHGLLSQLPSLAADVLVPRLVFGRLAACNAWLGTAGTVTHLHTDDAHNLLVAVAGWKLVRLVLPPPGSGEPGARALALALRAVAHPAASAASTLNLFSDVDAEGADARAAAALAAAGARLMEGLLAPGDALYIPRGAWHYVRSLTPAMSVNFWW